jgi:hypothetical protein
MSTARSNDADRAAVAFTIPSARGQRGSNCVGRTFAVLVESVDRSQPDDEAIVGERVRGRVRARVGTLVLVYGEDRSIHDGRLLSHCIDLYRLGENAELARLDFGTLTDPWLPPVLASIEGALAGVYDD